MFDRVYVEIGNICNMNCSFCSGTKREKRQMSEKEFEGICKKLSGYTENLLLHVMGEPLLHPKLEYFLQISKKYGYKISITTNGTLISRAKNMLIANRDAIHRISFSLHAPEGNSFNQLLDEYLDSVISFAKEFSALDKNVVFRLWNLDTDEKTGANEKNAYILNRLHEEYQEEWMERYSGYRLAYRTFLEFDGIFTWPSESEAEACDRGRCLALSRQIAILADGTVVPCCLDSEGLIPLGNIFFSELSDILSSPAAKEMLDGFRRGVMVHPVCKKCTYARRFSR